MAHQPGVSPSDVRTTIVRTTYSTTIDVPYEQLKNLVVQAMTAKDRAYCTFPTTTLFPPFCTRTCYTSLISIHFPFHPLLSLVFVRPLTNAYTQPPPWRKTSFIPGSLIANEFSQKPCSFSGPYSRFRVGCAVLTDTGAVVTGVNVENASYPVGICAERCAIARAVAEGHRRITAVAVATDNSPPGTLFPPPCFFFFFLPPPLSPFFEISQTLIHLRAKTKCVTTKTAPPCGMCRQL